MDGQRFWVKNGKLGPQKGKSPSSSHFEERKKFFDGQVCLTTGHRGTEIKWVTLSPCLSSLFVVDEWLLTAQAPYTLRFYVSGWFEEIYETYYDVSRRLEEIISRGDRHLARRTYVQEVEPSKSLLTPLLNDCYLNRISPEEYAVECFFDEASRQFLVDKVGAKSPIGKFYGTFLSSFPCQPVGSYNDIVNEGYWEVLSTGKPRTDHIMAAFRLPDNQVHWVPYQRLILPSVAAEGQERVAVISEISNISFNVI
jgi:hypothetical protein